MNQQQRYEGALSLIKSQTNYTEEESKKKLDEWNGNYMNVIKEYLNPNFKIKLEKKDNRSVNQKVMGEIRGFMDTVTMDFQKRKAEEEKKQEYLKENMFDIIVGFNSLHWVKNQYLAFDNIFKSLKPSGKLLALTTTFISFKIIKNLWFIAMRLK